MLEGSFLYTLPTFARSLRVLARVLTGHVHEHSPTNRRHWRALQCIIHAIRVHGMSVGVDKRTKMDIASALHSLFTAIDFRYETPDEKETARNVRAGQYERFITSDFRGNENVPWPELREFLEEARLCIRSWMFPNEPDVHQG